MRAGRHILTAACRAGWEPEDQSGLYSRRGMRRAGSRAVAAETGSPVKSTARMGGGM